jgi:hypothetical protein
MAWIAAAMPTPPNMKLRVCGPTHRLSSSGRYQRFGLWVLVRFRKGVAMGRP